MESQNKPIEVVIKRHNRLIMSLHPSPGLLTVKAPRDTSDAAIANFVSKHKAWIEKNCEFHADAQMLLGYPIDWGQAKHQGFELPQDLAVDKRRAHKMLCHEVLNSLFHATVKAHGFDKVPLSIRTLASAWGKCHASGRIELHWQSATLPLNLAQYVICHELAHLDHLNHSQAFWARLEYLYPGARRTNSVLSKWIKQGP